MGGKQKIFLQNNFEWEVNGKPIFSMLHHVSGGRLDFEKTVLYHCFDRDTFPQGVKFAPTRHAMNIHLDFCARQLIKLIPRPAFFFLHLAPNAEIPGSGVEMWHWTIMQNREFECKRLPGRKTPLFSNTILLFAAIATFRR